MIYVPRWLQTGLAFAALVTAIPLFGAISPSQLDVNLGPFPVNLYLSPNNSCGSSCNGQYYPSCSATSTIQQCVKSWFQGSNGYIAQGVQGVRLYFPLGGGNYSTFWNIPANPNASTIPTINSTWVSNFSQLMKDLKSYGVKRVNPNIILIDPWAGSGNGEMISPNPPITSVCDGGTLSFFLWLPFGLEQPSYYPDCNWNANGYASASANPYFWGWGPYFNAVSTIVRTVQEAGLGISDFEAVGEINLTNFTVEGRMLWDNKHGSSECSNGTFNCTAVLSGIRYYLSYYGFNPGVVDYSIAVNIPTAAAFDCGSVYGDSAMLLQEDSVLGAIAGPYGLFGPVAGFTVSNGLICGGNTSQMISLPVDYLYDQPTSTDIHAYICVADSDGDGNCNTSVNATSTAEKFFSDVWALLSNHGLTSNYVVFGETLPNQPITMEPYNWTQTLTSQQMNGYLRSTLYSNHASDVTFRPFENPDWNATYNGIHEYPQIPAPLTPPY